MPLMDAGNVAIWQALKLFLPPNTQLTSCRRPAAAQLAIIKTKAEQLGYKFQGEVSLSDPASWEPALEFIRAKGYKVAAPNRSKHQQGLAYDLSGPNLEAIKAAVEKAVSLGRIHLVNGSKSKLLIERINHCVHVEIDQALIDYEPFEFA